MRVGKQIAKVKRLRRSTGDQRISYVPCTRSKRIRSSPRARQHKGEEYLQHRQIVKRFRCSKEQFPCNRPSISTTFGSVPFFWEIDAQIKLTIAPNPNLRISSRSLHFLHFSSIERPLSAISSSDVGETLSHPCLLAKVVGILEKAIKRNRGQK